jgi:hypothetical protein
MKTRAGIGLATAVSLTLLVFCVASATAATWTVTDLKDDGVGGHLFAISCPSEDLCVAGGSDSLIATSTDPGGGPNAWRTFHPGGSMHIEAPPGAAGVMFPGRQIRGISCPTTSLCIGVTYDDRVFSSTDPTGGPDAWKVIERSGRRERHTHMTSVSCPSTTLCVAVGFGSKIVSSTNPTGDATAWAEIELDGRFDFRGVTCPTTAFCVAVDNEGGILTSRNPTGPPSAWEFVGRPGGVGSLNAIACPTLTLCVTGNAGQMITSVDPLSGAASWRAVPAGTGLPVKGIACPTTSACAAVDNNSDAIVSTDPTGGANAWSFTNVIPGPMTPGGSQNGMFGISCPSLSLCVGVGAMEQIIFSLDAFAPTPVVGGPHGSKRLRVAITHHPAKRVRPRGRRARVTFRFRALDEVARYQCKLNQRAFRTCKSPRRYRLGKGRYAFKVRAIGTDGTKGPVTTFHFRVGHLTEHSPPSSCPDPPLDQRPVTPFEPCVGGK